MDSVSGKLKGQTVKEYKPDALSTDTFKRTSVETTLIHHLRKYFSVYGNIAGILNNANNSDTTGYVRNLWEFPGFLVIQTFYSQDHYTT